MNYSSRVTCSRSSASILKFLPHRSVEFFQNKEVIFSRYCKFINYILNITHSLVLRKKKETKQKKSNPYELLYFLLHQILKRIQKYVSLEMTWYEKFWKTNHLKNNESISSSYIERVSKSRYWAHMSPYITKTLVLKRISRPDVLS